MLIVWLEEMEKQEKKQDIEYEQEFVDKIKILRQKVDVSIL